MTLNDAYMTLRRAAQVTGINEKMTHHDASDTSFLLKTLGSTLGVFLQPVVEPTSCVIRTPVFWSFLKLNQSLTSMTHASFHASFLGAWGDIKRRGGQ